ncbi:hypothetical protein [Spiroplasma endosymbiont of Labia minor]|uniref:hypothetical protein n=1 Tax=Spiroplasma endosymbiont of Labia minor TaxID=3066305 RepID=UPI0030D3612B
MISTKNGIINTFVGSAISIFGAIIQFMSIYLVLKIYGTEFNGFIRICSSFTLVIGTADGALGIATTLLLVKPISQNDWITANEIFSTSYKKYRKNLILVLPLALIIAIVYPLYITISNIIASNGSFDASSFLNSAGISTNSNGNQGFFVLFGIIMFYCLKNIGQGTIFGVYENIMAADSKNAIKRIVVLFVDTTIYGVLFSLIAFKDIPFPPVIPFSILILYSPIRGLMIMLYVKRHYAWLKFYKDYNSFNLNTTTQKISISKIGITLLTNTDLIIVALILGLNVSSVLSLYMVIAINVRIIMTNFITSFREFFIVIVANNGRIYWNSYSKYELYVYLVAAFTFVNMSMLSPYFVSALYGNIINEEIQSATIIWAENEKLLFDFVFSSPLFSFVYAIPVVLYIIQESQMNIIQAKGTFSEVTKFQNITGLVYLIIAIISTLIFKYALNNNVNNLLIALNLMYGLKIIFSLIICAYLWIYIWKYATYNSTFKNVFSNLLVLIIPIIVGAIVSNLWINKILSLQLEHLQLLHMSSLIGLFFSVIGASIVFIISVALLFSPKLILGIIKRLPIVNQIIKLKSKKEKEERLEKEGMELFEITDTDYEIKENIDNLNILENDKDSTENIERTLVDKKTNIYKLKGK